MVASVGWRAESMPATPDGGMKQSRLEKEMANMPRLVEESVQSINRFAHELDIRQPA
jgi:hypothetical protein